MGAGAEVAAGIAGGVLSAIPDYINTFYNIQKSERDFDYQKALQDQIFNREDNAVQRRMADLKAAGLNPNLAAGSAANAGSVVGRSNTPQLNMQSHLGAALDTAMAVQQLRMQREQNEILKNQAKASNYSSYNTYLNMLQNEAQIYSMLNLNPEVYFKNGLPRIKVDQVNKYVDATPLGLQLQYQLNSNKNSAALLQKDVDWYNAQQIEQLIGTAARAAAGFGNAYKGFNWQAPNYQTYHNSQNFYANPYIKNNW